MAANKLIKNNIYADLKRTGVPTRDVIKALGMKSDKTFYSRVNNPDTFTAREIRILRRFCQKETCDMITQ